MGGADLVREVWDPLMGSRFCFDFENRSSIVDRTTKTVNVVEFVTPDPFLRRSDCCG